MKEKILAAIKAKFPKVNLSKKRLDEISAKIEKKVIDDETKIDAAIDEFNDFNPLADIAKTDDRLRDLEAKTKAAPGEKDKLPEENKVEIPDDTPPYIKALLESNKLIQEKLALLEGEKTANTIKSKAEGLLKEIPVSYWGKRALPVKAEELETFVEEVKTDYKTFTDELTDKGISIQTTPKSGSGGGGGGDAKASEKEVAAIVDNIM